MHCKESVTHHGEAPWERAFRTPNAVGDDGPTSVEWEDAGMERALVTPEALGIIQPPAAALDAAFSTGR